MGGSKAVDAMPIERLVQIGMLGIDPASVLAQKAFPSMMAHDMDTARLEAALDSVAPSARACRFPLSAAPGWPRPPSLRSNST